MATISYSIVLNPLLNKAPLLLEQMEAVIEIGGPAPDPLTLQQIRDEDSINQCFNARRKNINELIITCVAQLRKAKTEAAAEKLVDEFNKELKTETAQLQKELQTRVDNFCVRQKKDVNDLFWARAKMACRVIYSAAKLVKSGLEMVAKVGAAVAGPGIFVGIVAIKSLISSSSDLGAAYDEIVSSMESERTQHEKIKAAVKRLKAIKAPKPVPQGDIDELEGMLGPYGARLLGVDSAAKSAANKLDAYLVALEKGKFRDAKGQQTAEKMVEFTIDKVVEMSKNVAEGRKLLQSARSKIVDASKRAKAAPTSWWDYAPNIWKLVDGLIDMREESLDVSGFKATFKKCHEVLKGKLEDEMRDALMEAHAK